jgi:hypothetical protein
MNWLREYNVHGVLTGNDMKKFILFSFVIGFSLTSAYAQTDDNIQQYSANVAAFIQKNLSQNSIWKPKFHKMSFTYIVNDKPDSPKLVNKTTIAVLPDGTMFITDEDEIIPPGTFPDKPLGVYSKLIQQRLGNFINLKFYNEIDNELYLVNETTDLNTSDINSDFTKGSKLTISSKIQLLKPNKKTKQTTKKANPLTRIVGDKYSAKLIHENLNGQATQLICRYGDNFEKSFNGFESAFLDDYGVVLTTRYKAMGSDNKYKYFTMHVE